MWNPSGHVNGYEIAAKLIVVVLEHRFVLAVELWVS